MEQVDKNKKELTLSRVFDAPRELVFEAFSSCAHVSRWWGPKGWTLPFCKMDFRPGGVWHYCIRGPKGEESWGKSVYQEIVKPERIVFVDAFADKDGNTVKGMPEMVITNTFEDQAGKTKLTSVTQFATLAELEKIVAMGVVQGINETWDRLAELLPAPAKKEKVHGPNRVGASALPRPPTSASDREAASTANREMVLTRVFDAPRELVFDAWTGAKRIGHWWGPRGFTTTTHEMGFRPGGVWRFIMHGPDGVDYKNKIVYIEIVTPERLVFAHSSGEEGDPGFRTTVTFAEEAGKTRLTMQALFETAEARDQAVKFGAIEGGNQTLERLAEYLAAARAADRK